MISFVVAASLPARAVVAGLPWAIVALAASLAIPRQKLNAVSLIGTIGVGLAWLLLFILTGDRRLFFPYTIHFAIQSICLLDARVHRPALLGGGLSIIIFTAIRVVQGATLAVLSVEWIVAAAVLALITAAWRRSSRSSASCSALSLAGSLLAFAGLLL